MISYSFGKGRVVLSTLYMDWAAGNHQNTLHEKLFFRDLMTFLLEDVPLFAAEEKTVRLPVPQADSGTRGEIFVPLLIGPDGAEIRGEKESSGAGEVILTQAAQPGYYRLGGIFTDAEGKKVGEAFPAVRFARSVLPPYIAGGEAAGGINLAAASDFENYIRGAEGNFSILVWNRGTSEKKVRVDWSFPHNHGAADQAEKSRYSGSNSLNVQPGARESIEITIPIVNRNGNDHLWANAFDGDSGKQMARVNKGFYTREPSTEVLLSLEKELFREGDSIRGKATFSNPFMTKTAGVLRLRASDAAGNAIIDLERDFEAEAGETAVPFEAPLPARVFSGSCSLQAFVILKGTIAGSGGTQFGYMGEPAPLKGTLRDRMTGDGIADG
ncbi:MAG: hypothetical protein GX310_06315, partial [Synergistaceae bacterium]|nr:hypothetical protein [Synergistaceae bacterium]